MTDGTAAGTSELSVAGALASGLHPTDLARFGSEVLFSGTDANDRWDFGQPTGRAPAPRS